MMRKKWSIHVAFQKAGRRTTPSNQTALLELLPSGSHCPDLLLPTNLLTTLDLYKPPQLDFWLYFPKLSGSNSSTSSTSWQQICHGSCSKTWNTHSLKHGYCFTDWLSSSAIPKWGNVSCPAPHQGHSSGTCGPLSCKRTRIGTK